MKAGRKRSFDKEEVLEKAVRVFWENGYSGTSLADLTSALGINKPSMYAAFGNKEQLFAKALGFYLVNYRGPVVELLTQPSEAPLKQRLRAFLSGVIDVVANPGSPKGCFYTKSCCEADSNAIPEELTDLIQEIGLGNEQMLMEQLAKEQTNGELAQEVDVKTMASYLLTVMTGLSVQAKNGRTREELLPVVDMVVSSLPGVLEHQY